MKKGEKIKELRAKLGLTQEEFSKKIGLSRSSLALIETNKNNPTINVYERINEVFNVNLIGNKSNIVINSNNEKSRQIKFSDIESDIRQMNSINNDNLLFLFFLTSILRLHKYNFTKSELKDLLFYKSLSSMIDELEEMDTFEEIIYTNMKHMYKANIYRTIMTYINICEKKIGITMDYNFDWADDELKALKSKKSNQKE